MLFLLASSARLAAANCTLQQPPNISFPNYYINIAVYTTTTVTVNCPSGTAYTVGISAGRVGTDTNRSMQNASVLLGYGLFSDAAYSHNWGNTAGTGWVSGTGSGSNQVLTVWAKVPANEYVTAGGYNDQVVATLTSNLGTSQSNIGVGGSVQNGCAISATSLAFGTYAGSLVNSTSTITATCTNGTTYNVGLNAGTATGATVTNRSMTGPGGTLLGYKLFSNSGHTINWGNTVGTDTVARTGTGLAQSLTVYGQTPSGQNVVPGSYADTITATLTY